MKIIASLYFLIVFLACSNSSSEKGISSDVAYHNAEIVTEEVSEQQAKVKETSENIQRKLIKRGNVSFETTDLSKTKQNISIAVEKYNGYISNENEYKSSDRISNSITARIPSKNFDSFLIDISSNVEKFDNKNISVSDVTEEFLDVQARLKVKKSLEQRYSELLKKAKSVKEILEVEKELTAVRSDIESMEGRLKYLQNQVYFSTLTINFYKIELVNSTESSFFRRLARAFSNGISNIKWFFIALVNIWPFILLGVLTFIFIRKRIKKQKK